jgi:hypothetical protein
MTQRLRVLASPGLADRFANPYTWHLYSNIKHSRVHDFTYTNVVARAYDVVHFHWPEEPLNYEASALTTSMRLARASFGRYTIFGRMMDAFPPSKADSGKHLQRSSMVTLP